MAPGPHVFQYTHAVTERVLTELPRPSCEFDESIIIMSLPLLLAIFLSQFATFFFAFQVVFETSNNNKNLNNKEHMCIMKNNVGRKKTI